MFNLLKNNNYKLVNKHGFDLVLIIDRSGSMEGTERNIMDGHQRMVNYLNRISKKITLTTILFDDDIVVACDGKRIDDIKKLNYRPEGTTALFDAWGTAIIHENNRKKNKNNPYPDADVLYLTITDGGENSSRIFNMEKIREMMMQERRRSVEGRGVREFATINEFGIDNEEMERNLKIGKNNSQIFFRSDEGLSILFKIVGLAAENMLQYRRITDKWIKKSDQLKIGSYTLGQIKNMTKKPQRVLANLEKIYMELLLEADDGLTEKFWNHYYKYENLTKKLEQTKSFSTGDEEIDEMLSLYIYKNECNLKYAYQHAKDAMVDKAAVRCGIYLGKIREIAEKKEATVKAFVNLVGLYNQSVKKLEDLPVYFTHLKSARIADRISMLVYEHDKKYEELANHFFKCRLVFLKEAFGTNDDILFNRLADFTREPNALLFRNLQKFNEFCGWVELFIKEKNEKREAV